MRATVARAMLLLAVLIHWLPLRGIAGAASLERLYGLGALDASTELLMQHRALLFALLSLPLLLAVLRRREALPGAALLLASDVAFALLALGHWPLGAALQRVWLLDLVSIGLLIGGALLLRERAAHSQAWR
jgi:hypothetical protein